MPRFFHKAQNFKEIYINKKVGSYFRNVIKLDIKFENKHFFQDK